VVPTERDRSAHRPNMHVAVADVDDDSDGAAAPEPTTM
jgi:hypothetical protein